MINFTRINSDVNGNPRYVCHWLAFNPYHNSEHSFSYEEALKLARRLGGRKFHNKQYGGGIVFQSYNIQSLSDKIQLLTGHMVEYSRGPNAYELKMGYGAIHYRAFKREDVTNRKGELKKWLKRGKTTYSRV